MANRAGKSRAKRPWIRSLTIVALFLGLAVGTELYTLLGLRNEISRARQDGLYTSATEIRASLQGPGEDASAFYQAGLASINKITQVDRDAIGNFDPYDRIPDDAVRPVTEVQARTALRSWAELMQTMEMASKCPRLVVARPWDRHGQAADVLDLVDGAAKAFAAEAELAAASGEVELVARRLRNIRDLGIQLGTDPMLPSFGAGLRTRHLSLQTAAHIAFRFRRNKELLRRIRELATEPCPAPDLRVPLRPWGLLSVLRTEAAAKKGDNEIPAGSEVTLAVTSVRRLVEARMIRSVRALVNSLPEDASDFSAAQRVVEEHQRASKGPWFIGDLTSVLLPSLDGFPQASASTVARARILAAFTVLLEDYVAKGKWPDRLPAAAAGVTDPIDGKPLRYHRLPNGFVLYSVGIDGIDGGGGSMATSIKEDISLGVENGVLHEWE